MQRQPGHAITITFFQFKGEAKSYFQDLAKEFEAANPGIRVVVDSPADPETALRTRLVKNDVPDVMTLNGNGTFGEFATAKIFKDFSTDPVLKAVNPAFPKVIGNLGRGGPNEINGVPFAANASGLLYNEELFAKYDVAVPQTFDELIAAAETFKANGVTPFYGMLADNWTPQSPLAPLSAQLQPPDFFQQRFKGQTTFAEGWRSTAEELGKLVPVHPAGPAVEGVRGRDGGLRQGRVGHAAARAATPSRRSGSGKPSFTVGSMALPATDDPAKTTLVSGVDVLITASRDGAHPQEVAKFIDFLMQPDVMTAYCKAQVAIPTLDRAQERRPGPGRGADLHRLRPHRRVHRPPVHSRYPAGTDAAELRAVRRREHASSPTSTPTGTGSPNAAPGD